MAMKQTENIKSYMILSYMKYTTLAMLNSFYSSFFLHVKFLIKSNRHFEFNISRVDWIYMLQKHKISNSSQYDLIFNI